MLFRQASFKHGNVHKAPCTLHVFYWSQQLVIMSESVSFVSPPCMKELEVCTAAPGQQVAIPAIQCQRAFPYQRLSCAGLVPHGSASCRATTAQTNSLSTSAGWKTPAQKDHQRTTIPWETQSEQGICGPSVVTVSCSTGLQVSGMRLN